MVRSKLMPAVLLALSVVAFIGVPGCATFKAQSTNTQIAEQIAVQYATGKFIEGGGSTDAKLARARQVKAVAVNLKSVAANDSATIAALQDLAMAQVAKANLAPSDRLLATTLVSVAVQELSARVSAGVLDPDAKVIVSKLLDWVIAAASAYG